MSLQKEIPMANISINENYFKKLLERRWKYDSLYICMITPSFAIGDSVNNDAKLILENDIWLTGW